MLVCAVLCLILLCLYRYLLNICAQIAPAAAGRLVWFCLDSCLSSLLCICVLRIWSHMQGSLAQLDSQNPVMYVDFPQGRLKFLGTIVFPKNKYMLLKFGQKDVLCEDIFENMVGTCWTIVHCAPGSLKLLGFSVHTLHSNHAGYRLSFQRYIGSAQQRRIQQKRSCQCLLSCKCLDMTTTHLGPLPIRQVKGAVYASLT